MVATLAFVCCLAMPVAPTKTVSMLFLGNSHTENNDMPTLVKRLLESNDLKLTVETETLGCAFLNDLDTTATLDKIRTGHYTYVVLQAAKISSSHRYTYSQDGGIEIARAAKAAGSRVLYFAEWPRKGWDEGKYIFDVYDGMRQAAGGEVVPICYAFDQALANGKKYDLWVADGNHSSPLGAYLAACVFYFHILGPKAPEPQWQTPGLRDADISAMISAARRTVKSARSG